MTFTFEPDPTPADDQRQCSRFEEHEPHVWQRIQAFEGVGIVAESGPWRCPGVEVPARVVVDPNSVSLVHPGKTVADSSDASRPVRPGERVVAVQPDDTGRDYVGDAVVVDVDSTHGVIYLEVDWDSFHDQPEVDT